jgi:hypothetical protein
VTLTRREEDRVLHVWQQRRAEANERTTEQERRVKAIQQKLDPTTEIGSIRTAATAALFNYVAPSESVDEKSGM